MFRSTVEICLDRFLGHIEHYGGAIVEFVCVCSILYSADANCLAKKWVDLVHKATEHHGYAANIIFST